MNEFEKSFNDYAKLGLEKKRDSFNEELNKISYILKFYLNKFN